MTLPDRFPLRRELGDANEFRRGVFILDLEQRWMHGKGRPRFALSSPSKSYRSGAAESSQFRRSGQANLAQLPAILLRPGTRKN
jgi:hypothetical protein